MEPMGGLDHETTLCVATDVVLVSVRQNHFKKVLEVSCAVFGLDIGVQGHCAADGKMGIHIFPRLEGCNQVCQVIGIQGPNVGPG